MEINDSRKFTKKMAVRNFLIVLGIVIATILVTFIGTYGTIPDKFIIPILIALAVVVPAMVIGTIIGFKHQNSIKSPKSKFWYIFMAIGLLMILINLALVFWEGNNFNYYNQIVIGFMFVIFAIYKIRHRVNNN